MYRQEATAEQQRLTRALAAAERRATEAEKDAAALGEEVFALEKKAHTLAVNAKYDASARDGQVKRARILQTELEETREDNAKMEDRLRELERHKTVFQKRGVSVAAREGAAQNRQTGFRLVAARKESHKPPRFVRKVKARSLSLHEVSVETALTQHAGLFYSFP